MKSAIQPRLPIPPAPELPTPSAFCDLLIDAAMASGAELIWFEPRLPGEDRYDIALERQGRVLATTTVPGTLGGATVARLALLCELDLVARRAVTGACQVRGPEGTAEVVVTTRAGRALRAEVAVRGSRPRAVSDGPTRIEPGAQLGQYRLLERLGAGGMGEVFEVSHTVLGRHHALKVLRREAAQSDDAGARFLREARAAARIRHPGIVDVFDFGYTPDGRPYLVMELLDGSLASHLADGALEPQQALRWARQLASALGAAHDAGVIHADVSPTNVLLAGDTVKLVDFGLAQLRDDPARAAGARAEYVLGTPSYIAPEVVRGLPADEKSDQYALGAVLFEMIAGRPPYAAPTIRELCIKHLVAPIPVLTGGQHPVPPELDRVVARCLAKRPADRFPTMRELDAALVEVEQALYVQGWRRWLAP